MGGLLKDGGCAPFVRAPDWVFWGKWLWGEAVAEEFL